MTSKIVIFALFLFYSNPLCANGSDTHFNIDCRHSHDYGGTRFYFETDGSLRGQFQKPYGNTIKTFDNLQYVWGAWGTQYKELLITGKDFYVRFVFRMTKAFYGVGTSFSDGNIYNFYTDNCTLVRMP